MNYLELFLTFMKIGAFTFGGGYAMLPLIQAEVNAHDWMTQEELLNFIAVSESTPGPLAVNISTYVGAENGGFWGALCATAGVVLPSFLIILLLARCYEKFKSSFLVKSCMSGLRPAVVGIIGAAVLSSAGTVFFPDGFSFAVLADPSFFFSALWFLLMAVLALKKVHPILLLCLSGCFGILLSLF